jgi:hypothetical protein
MKKKYKSRTSSTLLFVRGCLSRERWMITPTRKHSQRYIIFPFYCCYILYIKRIRTGAGLNRLSRPDNQKIDIQFKIRLKQYQAKRMKDGLPFETADFPATHELTWVNLLCYLKKHCLFRNLIDDSCLELSSCQIAIIPLDITRNPNVLVKIKEEKKR